MLACQSHAMTRVGNIVGARGLHTATARLKSTIASTKPVVVFGARRKLQAEIKGLRAEVAALKERHMVLRDFLFGRIGAMGNDFNQEMFCLDEQVGSLKIDAEAKIESLKAEVDELKKKQMTTQFDIVSNAVETEERLDYIQYGLHLADLKIEKLEERRK